MEKKTYDFCLHILRRLRDVGVLDRMVLVGSWCLVPYAEHFSRHSYLPAIRTRDVEFLISDAARVGPTVDLHALLDELGFVVDYKGAHGHMVFQHPELIVEFLAPARGRERKEPYPVPALGINAQPLRFMDLLADGAVQMAFGDVRLTVPHPANFAIHKLLIAGRRKQAGKSEKDRSQAIGVLRSLRATGRMDTAAAVFRSIHEAWRNTVRRELASLGAADLLALLEADG